MYIDCMHIGCNVKRALVQPEFRRSGMQGEAYQRSSKINGWETFLIVVELLSKLCPSYFMPHVPSAVEVLLEGRRKPTAIECPTLGETGSDIT